jgi:hypothetical protein
MTAILRFGVCRHFAHGSFDHSVLPHEVRPVHEETEQHDGGSEGDEENPRRGVARPGPNGPDFADAVFSL